MQVASPVGAEQILLIHQNQEADMPVAEEMVVWGCRLLLGEDETDPGMIERHKNNYNNLEDLRTTFMRTQQAQALFRKANGTKYMIPPFLLRRPERPVSWCFKEPSLVGPGSQLCTEDQMNTPYYERLCRMLGIDAGRKHRKHWEFAYILAALEAQGSLSAGHRGLGFGTGREQLPSFFASCGVMVTATDAPSEIGASAGWAQTDQWSENLNDLFHADLVTQSVFRERVEHRSADMNAIPDELRDYDFCWSACCLEHLGSIRQGLDFICNSLQTLKPGGIAVHTTEFNLVSNDSTIEEPWLSLFRKKDIETIAYELTHAGHHVEPLNFWPGATPVDEHIDLPPYSSPHLKLALMGYATTSIGMIIRKSYDA